MNRLLPASLVAIACATAPGASADGLRRPGFLGVQVEGLPAGAPQAPGLAVRALVDGGSARQAGVRSGDVIKAIGGRRVTTTEEFVAAARQLRGGDVAALDVLRAGDPLRLEVAVKPRPPESAPDLDVDYGAVKVDGHLRRTLVTVPRAPGPSRRSAVLFVTGVGCFSQEIADPRDNVAQLLYGLTRAGFVTMRVEKSGEGDSQGPACSSPQADMAAEVRGYVAGLRALKADPRVDAGRVFIVGLSIGGVEAPLIEREEAVKGVVVINTAAKPFMEYLLETRRRQALMRGMPFDEADRHLARVLRCNYAALVSREAPQDLHARMPACREEIRFPAPLAFMRQWAALNPGEAWRAVDSPVLVVIGTSDWVATVAESPYLVEMINGFRAGRATLQVIEGMDHGLSRAPTMQQSLARRGPGEFEPAVLEATADWLRRQAAS